MLKCGQSSSFRPRQWIVLITLICLFLTATLVAAPKKNATKKVPPLNLPPLKTQEQKMQLLGYIRQTMPTRRIARSVSFSSADLDQSLEQELGQSAQNALARTIDDETFLRRVYLDLTGTLPAPQKIESFIASENRTKRSDLIDELLETPEYARKWARYWTSVIFYESEANKNRISPQALEDWLAEQF
ncbi:MAG: DUF1549 domain-containing protein, partial [Planctomycetaceae bacterium]|nr:DUF1549 domain-containing protein [Planctomycetaceae bacterium]